ncbi:MAG: ribulose-phosphate 3-epimerase [Proteobacteria bacterium]|nr:ribulose-phosphate 3-epimerase [Pseudomonadota bacterium]
MFKIAPSILSANFARLEDEIKKVEIPGVQYLHVDVMDGQFVPNITIGAPVVKAIKKATKLPLDVHLMIVKPEKYIDDFIKAGADLVTIHVEATNAPDKVISAIKAKGVKAGLSVKPGTPLETMAEYYDIVDLILVMTVEPGFGGQKLIPSAIDKIRELRKIKDKGKYKFIIEADGGVTEDNIHEYVGAGAELIVAGNAVFADPNPTEAVKRLLSKGVK